MQLDARRRPLSEGHWRAPLAATPQAGAVPHVPTRTLIIIAAIVLVGLVLVFKVRIYAVGFKYLLVFAALLTLLWLLGRVRR